MAHIYLAAAHKSSGKTSVAIGLSAALQDRGLNVQPFKKGPDYIDPLWLARAAGRPCYNLDFYTQSKAEILSTFGTQMTTADIGLIEGNKGLYDGLDTGGSDSNAAMAKLLTAPVVLVIDASGMSRGIAPLVRGYLDFDPDVNICGVILNKVGGARHASKLRAALERYTDTRVLGVIGRDAALDIPERHLGLIPANEASRTGAADKVIKRLGAAVVAGVDLDPMLDIAKGRGRKDRGRSQSPGHLSAQEIDSDPNSCDPNTDIHIAIAQDAAFGFYYPDDLKAFADAGAELVPFDTLTHSHLPDADGLFIGGGFPETQLEALAANQSLLTEIRQALATGMPAYAECGGLMYLARSIRWRGESMSMVGAVAADVIVHDRPQGRGYVRLAETGNSPWPTAAKNCNHDAANIPAHEFHYARLENLSEVYDFAYQVQRGTGIDGEHDGLICANLLAGFAHHRNTLANPWVKRFVAFVRSRRINR